DQQNQFISDNSLNRFKRQAHNSLTYPEKRWPKNVTYSLDGNLGEEAIKVFRKAVELWTNNTCINFEEDKEETAEDLLLVYKEHGCWAEVGRQVLLDEIHQ
ncbi:astacin, partial [Ostertagia ostertagi]